MVWAHGIVTGSSSEENDSFFWSGAGHVPGETMRFVMAHAEVCRGVMECKFSKFFSGHWQTSGVAFHSW